MSATAVSLIGIATLAFQAVIAWTGAITAPWIINSGPWWPATAILGVLATLATVGLVLAIYWHWQS